ncbi:HNH endonuclease signature motif containing protein [Corynebacterium alimapuense]|uniref:HNH endonuclease n=1 Tax=Corynebacterium alimapuense TaxID=1576874 RepID=A0A3M8K9M7_9CORY|nr:HNH endonuclease signature motif containing protein [Corynebacterium alimapuense]RNE49850.1 HNH endonuclease [Corynebacterium alimapuense]
MTATTICSPAVFHTPQNPDCALARASQVAQRADFHRWQVLAQAMDPELDADVQIAVIAKATGMASGYIQSNLVAMETLNALPLLHALQEQLCHLDMHRLRAIDSALSVAEASQLPALDEELLRWLTPTKAHQSLPGARAIARHIRGQLVIIDDTLPEADVPPPPPEWAYSMRINDDGTADLYARFDAQEAVAIDSMVRALAAAEGISQPQAHARLVSGDAQTRITLNLYQAKDIPNAPVFLPRAGWLSRAAGNELANQATTVREIDQMSTSVTTAYSTPEAMEAFIEGRDGTCRFPGCGVSAEFCDNDHRINHAEGGETGPTNLFKLCRHHHNLKTAGRVFYLQDPHNGDVVWLLADGTYVTDEPTGPLSAASKRWLQTVNGRKSARDRKARTRAQAQKREERDQS